MDVFVKMEPLEEVEHFSGVKTEPLDYNTEQFGKLKCNYCFDSTEIAKYVKSELSIIKSIFSLLTL